MIWRVVKDSLLIGRYNASSIARAASQGKQRVAAFDFVSLLGDKARRCFVRASMLMLVLQDSTLVTPASGKKFGRDASDWKWWHNSIPGKLKQLHEEG